MTKISSRGQILQRTGDQIHKGFAQDTVQQRWAVPEMWSSWRKCRRWCLHAISSDGHRRISERICGQRGVIEVTKISNQDQNLVRIVEQTLVDSGDQSISQFVEEIFEDDNIVLLERISEKTCDQSGSIEVTETSSRESVEAVKIIRQERISKWMGEQIGVIEVTETSSRESVEVRSEFLNGCVKQIGGIKDLKPRTIFCSVNGVWSSACSSGCGSGPAFAVLR